MQRPDLDAVARYTPFTDMAMAVTAPDAAGSWNVEDFVQSEREIVTISVGDKWISSRPAELANVRIRTVCSCSNEEILARRVPDGRTIVQEFRRSEVL